MVYFFEEKTKRGAPMPYFMAYPRMDGMEAEEKNQRDYEYMKQLYPKRLQTVKNVIEEECDKLEYEGSIMFDEYPDRASLLQICEKIEKQTQNLEMQENNWMRDIIQGLLFDEMHRRRCRYRNGRCRRW